jgi:hypothetical protein
MPKVTVHIQVDEFPSINDLTFCMPLERQGYEFDALTPIDNAKFGDHVLFLHTPTEIAIKISRDRDVIAKQLTYSILKALAARDLINGYAKETP